jgi:hypothetical protein
MEFHFAGITLGPSLFFLCLVIHTTIFSFCVYRHAERKEKDVGCSNRPIISLYFWAAPGARNDWSLGSE